MSLHRILALCRNVFGRKRFSLMLDVASALFAQIVLLVVILHARDFGGVAQLLAVTAVSASASLYLFRAYRQIWSRVSLLDVTALTYASLTTSLIVAGAALWIFGPRAPLRVGVGSVVVLLAFWVGPRMLARLWWEGKSTPKRSDAKLEPVLLFGSGRRAGQFIKSNAIDQRYHIVGFFHDDPRVRGRQVMGVPGLGTFDRLGEVLENLSEGGVHPKRLVVTEDNEGPDDLARALDHAARHGMILCRLPSAIRLVSAGANEDRLQQVSIEDILHRETVSLNDPRVPRAMRGAVIMVTGAGGSIGAELVRQIATSDPAKIILVEFCEYNLYSIEHELAARFPLVPRVTALCDIRRKADLDHVFAQHRPDIVLHAAALKHVPLLEDHPEQAVLTNVLGTLNLAQLSLDHRVRQFTLVSTDKAVNPTNVMGCTKRWAEMICQSCDGEAERLGLSTRFACVRFGNVLGSAGSVVPLFWQQIAQGGPVTVTDEEITRYFMTIPEACELIVTATAATIDHAEREPRVFVLDMGAPVKILDLAKRMIQLHGLRPYEDIPITVTGLRPGEKMHEELAHSEERLAPASFSGAHLADSRAPAFAVVAASAQRLVAIAERGDHRATRAAMTSLVPEYAAAPIACPAPQVSHG